MNECWFAALPFAGPCRGSLQRAHLVPQQLMKTSRGFMSVPCPVARCDAGPRQRCVDVRTGAVLKKAHSDRVSVWNSTLWDSRCWRWGCVKHHHELDFTKTLRVPRLLIPMETEDFAAELDLTWWLEREYGPHEVEAA